MKYKRVSDSLKLCALNLFCLLIIGKISVLQVKKGEEKLGFCSHCICFYGLRLKKKKKNKDIILQ